MLSHRKSIFSNDFFNGFFTDSWLYSSESFGVEHKRLEDNSLVTTVELPGVSEKDITVEMSPVGVITVKGERKTKTSSYSVVKSFLAPKDVDTDQLTAVLKNGILTLSMPGKELPPAKEMKKITVTIDK